MLPAHQYAALLAALQEGTVLAVQQVANDIFQSTVFVVDNSLCMLAGDESAPVVKELGMSHVDNKQYLAPDMIKMFWEHDLINQIYNSPGKTILVNCGNFERYPGLATGIYYKKRVLGHVAVFLESETYESWKDEALLTVADALSIVMRQEHLSDTTILEEKELIARELFNGTLKETLLTSAMERGLIQKSPVYQVLAINDMTSLSHRLIPESCLSLTEGGYCLVLLSKPDRNHSSPLLSRISAVGFRYGLSADFTDLHHTHSAVVQARAVLKYGLGSATGPAGFHFPDHALDLILNESKDMKHYIHPAIYELQAYDLANYTHYFDTLRCYLDNLMDSSATTQALHIHRNSLYYRLEKIQELTNIDFKDSHTMIHLYLSIQYLFSK